MCPHCRAFITVKDRVCPYCHEEVAPRSQRSDDGSSMLAGFIPHVRFNTMIILLINFGLYMATTLYSMRGGNEQAFWSLDTKTLVMFGGKYNPLLAQGEWWRLVTAGFLHGGILHILMNSWVLFDLGAQVEELYGASRMLTIYFVSTVTGFYGSALWSPAVSVGASAGLFGLIGAMIALGMRSQTSLGSSIKRMYIQWAIYGLVLGMLTRFTDNAAHIGGLAGGFGVAWIAGTPRAAGTPREQVWSTISWVCIALTGLSFLKMYLWFAANSR